MTNDEFKNYAINLVKSKLKNYQEIKSVSEVNITECEWCSNSTKVIHINHTPQINDTGCVSTVFEDDNFYLQSEWWVCGKCDNS